MATEVDIANLSLLRVGVNKRLASLGDASAEGQACGFLYPLKRDAVLASVQWPFATRRAKLALLSGFPSAPEAARSGWAYVYAVPTECVAPCYLWAGTRNPRVEQRVPFVVEMATSSEGRVLLTDMPSAELVYVAQVTEAARFPPLFVDALSFLIASELARALRKDEALARGLLQQGQYLLAQAARAAFSEAQTDVAPPPDFIAERG